MQTFHHTMAHRGSTATRTNARWHPYTPPRPSGSIAAGAVPASCNYASLLSQSVHQQNIGYLLTPASAIHHFPSAQSTSSQSPIPATLLQKSQQQKQHQQSTLSTTAVKAHSARSSSDQGFVAVLLEQTVKSLSDIWAPESIPAIFKKNHQVHLAIFDSQCSLNQPTNSKSQQQRRNSVLLPSPCSPTTRTLPLSLTDESRAASFLNKHYSNAPYTERELLPLKHFVKEVLYRSRTTRPVLESALCYIEAVRKKIPELVRKEEQGLGVWGEPESDNRIEKEVDEAHASPASFDFSSNSSSDKAKTELMSTDSNAPTLLQTDATLPSHELPQDTLKHKRGKQSAEPLPPLVPLPSPLLCPRRTFLAALILASKFLQDRCYSNRAWAKLSGLPPREVGRCERALGDALEWRLWVGKGANVGESYNRNVCRTKSESALTFAASSSLRSDSYMPSPPLSDTSASPEVGRLSSYCEGRTLKRAATLPDPMAHRCVPPRYRQPGALPFSFAGPPVPVTCGSSLCTEETKKPFSSRTLKAEPTLVLTEESTPRISFSLSPTPMSEFNLSTPSTIYGNTWSPAPSTVSTDSSDSGSSVGSIATPPDLGNCAFNRNNTFYNAKFSHSEIAQYAKLNNVSTFPGSCLGSSVELSGDWIRQL